ncbi:hypothetical protein WHR41_01376 [Cladosporium halotolerans]|uniref:glucan endo-1,3-beta-D-glucosidase n=1 Tax=Cladosporium halotolerans TaxID=1052096 RepID=A0AB34L0A8_9PEZI
MSYNHAHDSNRPFNREDDWRDDFQPPVSPISINTSLNSLSNAQYGHHIAAGQIRAPNRSVSPIKGTQHPSWPTEMPPPPSGRGGQPCSPPGYYPQQRQAKPYMPTASDFSPPDPERRALQDIDNLFGPREVMSPSPEPQDYRSPPVPHHPSTPPRKTRSKPPQQPDSASKVPLMAQTRSPSAHDSPSPSRRHRQGPPRAAVGAAQSPYAEPREPSPYTQREYPATPPRQALRQNMHRHTDSASSNAPLMEHRGSPSGRGPPSPTRRGYGVPAAAVGGADAGGAAADYYGNEVPKRWQGEAYGNFDPSSIADDGDDGFEEHPRNKRSRRGLSGVGAFGGAAGADDPDKGGFKVFEVRRGNEERGFSQSPTRSRGDPEKSEWLDKQSHGKKRMKWIVGSLILLVVVAAVVGGTAGGILGMKNSNGNGSSTKQTSSSSSSGKDGGLYDIDSPEIKALLDNKAFHKVFPGMDYTPLNAQYPDCMHNPPDQNNITMDMAQLAQLTPAVRLYGTDCNQTEMVLTAIDRLGYNSTLQVWLGVWLGNNATTNDRQLSQMEALLRAYPASHFAGIIVGNEVLFRKDLTEAQLAANLTAVRRTLSDLSIDLPVATSDLGDDWTAQLAADSDIVLANVHPFFAGVTPAAAPGWTWSFWQNHNAALATSPSSAGKNWPRSIIAEVGWPSAGGTNCGGSDGTCSAGEEGATAGVQEMNAFMEGWVCPSLSNGTTYFWFEAYDEPWKKQFDTAGQAWESKWGLMDGGRELKEGLVVPDCGGRTVERAF